MFSQHLIMVTAKQKARHSVLLCIPEFFTNDCHEAFRFKDNRRNPLLPSLQTHGNHVRPAASCLVGVERQLEEGMDGTISPRSRDCSGGQRPAHHSAAKTNQRAGESSTTSGSPSVAVSTSRESDALLFHQSGEVKHFAKLGRVRSGYR